MVCVLDLDYRTSFKLARFATNAMRLTFGACIRAVAILLVAMGRLLSSLIRLPMFSFRSQPETSEMSLPNKHTFSRCTESPGFAVDLEIKTHVAKRRIESE